MAKIPFAGAERRRRPNPPPPKGTGHALRRWRGDKNVTLEVLAVDVNATSSHLSMIENGIRVPSLALAARLSKRTGIEIEQFVRKTGRAA